MGKTIRKTGISAFMALAIALPAIGSAAAAVEIDDALVRVSYADLNIQSEAGARVLYSRLKHASEMVCDVGSFSEHGSVERARTAKECYQAALSKFVDNIDSDELKKIHAG